MNYGEIINIIARQLHRNDLKTDIIKWTRLIHTFIQRGKYFRYQQTSWISEVLSKDFFHYSLPLNFLKEKQIFITDKDCNIIDQVYKTESPYFFEKKHTWQYRIWNDSIYIRTIDKDNYYRILIDGYEFLTLPDSESELETYKNYLSINYPNLIIWGTLFYGFSWLINKEMIDNWKDLYQVAWQQYFKEEVSIVQAGDGKPAKI